MKQTPSLWLMVLLLMLPQVVETIYSRRSPPSLSLLPCPSTLPRKPCLFILRLLPLVWCVGAFYAIDGDADQPCYLG